MEINDALRNSIASARQSLGMVTLRKAMNQDGSIVADLLENMKTVTNQTARAAESSVTPHKGTKIDIRI